MKEIDTMDTMGTTDMKEMEDMEEIVTMDTIGMTDTKEMKEIDTIDKMRTTGMDTIETPSNGDGIWSKVQTDRDDNHNYDDYVSHLHVDDKCHYDYYSIFIV